MIVKTFEIRDRGTFIVPLAVKLEPGCEKDRYLFGRIGFGITPELQAKYVQLAIINGGNGHCYCDPYNWPRSLAGTMTPAHQYILDHFDELESGAVIDSEFLRGESSAPKKSEAVQYGN